MKLQPTGKNISKKSQAHAYSNTSIHPKPVFFGRKLANILPPQSAFFHLAKNWQLFDEKGLA
ncbi:MAG: hypothetical protein D6768_13850 [Chloroflexi bacterium]|nr:MAG: hypothetical protein D6768_13850 [Chloroflexota bacterium]